MTLGLLPYFADTDLRIGGGGERQGEHLRARRYQWVVFGSEQRSITAVSHRKRNIYFCFLKLIHFRLRRKSKN